MKRKNKNEANQSQHNSYEKMEKKHGSECARAYAKEHVRADVRTHRLGRRRVADPPINDKTDSINQNYETITKPDKETEKGRERGKRKKKKRKKAKGRQWRHK